MTVALTYRGLLDILHKHHDNSVSDIKNHLRSFDKEIEDPREVHLQEVSGFWRMTMELVLRTYLHANLGFGILLLTSLVLLSWPLYFLVVSFGAAWWGLSKNREGYYQPTFLEPDLGEVKPNQATDTAHSNDNDEVVRRVVYEEAKVAKKN